MLCRVLSVMLIAVPSAGAQAHDWYPSECCHELDCAPVDSAERRDGVGLIVTTRRGTGVVPDTLQRRESKDEKMHVCMQRTFTGAMQVICIFVPPII